MQTDSTVHSIVQKDARSPLHFARFEFKYILSQKKRDEIEQALQHFLQYDPFVAEQPDHKYVVRSLYFDDPEYTAFYDKIEGLHSRSKFRLRTYSAEQPSADSSIPLFLEIKGRHNNLVFKHRTPVQRAGINWAELNGDALSQALLQYADKSSVLDQFEYALYRKRLTPVALIDYKRRPYVSKYDASFRLTFDEQLSARNVHTLYPGGDSRAIKILAGYTVLEVKFHHHMPAWFHRIIQTHEMTRVSVSKICKGMEVVGLAQDEP